MTVRERPIQFSSPMVRAILSGTKTQTRRVMNPPPPAFVQHTPDRHPPKHAAPYIDAYCSERKTEANPRGMSATWCWWTRDDRQGEEVGRCRYGVPGDRLWVREAWSTRLDRDHLKPSELDPKYDGPFFWADHETCNTGCGGAAGRKRASFHLPRWASRLTLEVSEVRVQRLQETTESDARAEGIVLRDAPDQFSERSVVAVDGKSYLSVGSAWAALWDSINGKRAAWASNPFVWAITFRRVEGGV